jgi:excisionase family DNA binding protein
VSPETEFQKTIVAAVRAEIGKIVPELEKAIANRLSPSRSAFLSTKQTCDRLHVSRTQLYRLFKAGKLTPVRRGRRTTLVHVDDADRYIAELRAGGDTKAA